LANNRRLTTIDVALTAVFTALYAVLGFLRISPIIGLTGQAITAAAIMAPIIGMLLGPYFGTLSAFLGGTIGFFLGSLSYLSFAGGIATAFCAGMIKTGRRNLAALVYLTLFLFFAFYPLIGPAWVFPLETWFQIVGLIILVSPLQSVAKKFLDSESSGRLIYGFFFTCLASTLAGQIAGSLVFEILAADPNVVMGSWPILTGIYPLERTIIALAAAFIGTALSKTLKSTSLPPSIGKSWHNRSESAPNT
jgi:predicted membrane protein